MSEAESMPTEWTHFYQQNNLGLVGATMFGDARVSEATAVTTTTTPVSSGGGAALSPYGRVSKPIRKRSRASRRTPTTLLNTDTTNFRAMVQQFTGGPAASFANTGPQQMGLVGQHGGPMMPGAASFHLPYHHQQQQQQQQQQQSQTASYMFSLSPGDQLLLQRLGNHSSVDGGADGFGEVAPPLSRRGGSSANGNGSGNSFMF